MAINSMHKTTIYLDQRLYLRIHRLADARGVTQAAIIREALAAYTAGGARRPRSVGLGRSGVRNLSEHAEDLLRGFGEDPLDT